MSRHRQRSVLELVKSALTHDRTPKRNSTIAHDKVGDIILRHATEDDFEGVCEMSRLAFSDRYKLDYLPGWFHRALEDPHRILCVAEKNKTIVGFAMGFGGVDSGKTILMEAGRLHPDVQKTGTPLVKQTIGHMLSQLAARWPQAERVRASSILTDYFDSAKDRYEILVKRLYINIHLPVSGLYSVKREPGLQLSKSSDEDFGRVLADENVAKILYPDGLISLGYNVFDAQPENISFIKYYHPNFVISDDETSISIGGGFPCDDQKALMYNFSYSGKINLTTFFEHLLEHLSWFLSQEPRNVQKLYLAITLSEKFEGDFGKARLKSALRDVLGTDDDIVLQTMYHLQTKEKTE